MVDESKRIITLAFAYVEEHNRAAVLLAREADIREVMINLPDNWRVAKLIHVLTAAQHKKMLSAGKLFNVEVFKLPGAEETE